MKANKYLRIIMMIILCGGSMNVFANTARISGDEFEGNRAWSGPHASFRIEGGETGSTTIGGDGRKLQLKNKKTSVIKWEVEENYTIEVTKVMTKIGAPAGGFDLYFNEIKCGNVGLWGTKDNIYLEGLTLSNADSITVRGTANQCNLYYIEITYTVTPNAPELVTLEDSIFVFEAPEALVLDTLEFDTLAFDSLSVDSLAFDSVKAELVRSVYLPAKFVTNEHLALEIEIVENPNGVGVISEDSVFTATEVGVYTFRARYKGVEGCHETSAWSELYTVYVQFVEEDEPEEPEENGENGENDDPGITTGLYDVQTQPEAQKFLRGNVILIRRGDAIFTIDGRRVE